MLTFAPGVVVRDKAYVPSFLAPPVPGCAAGTLNSDCDPAWPRYSQGTTHGHPAAGRAAGSVLSSFLLLAAWGETGPQGGVPGTTAHQAWPASLEHSAPALSEHPGLGRTPDSKGLSPPGSKPSWAQETRALAFQSQHSVQACHGDAREGNVIPGVLLALLPWPLTLTAPPPEPLLSRQRGIGKRSGLCPKVCPA